MDKKPFTPDAWYELKAFTDARISLGRCGSSLPLHESLSFKLAHAKARDAVWSPFNADTVQKELEVAGYSTLRLASSVADRMEYLTRPDKGRILSDASRDLLAKQPTGYDVCMVISDGLSSRAIHENAVPFAQEFLKLLTPTGLRPAPLSIVENGRVAIADEITKTLDAKLSIILIGERPGLSSPNSMGIYMTYAPRPGTTDESRNCISNVRHGGYSTTEAALKLAYLVENAFLIKTSGVQLKDKMPANYLPFSQLGILTEK